ncbi:RNA-binding motif protein 14b [Anaeramoeba flamelloides]|uniref:RNA-binding motif protein 14b n=1 Tax=Anaeramoeba flamelloides TaxID=1746091 RepID=A0AAV7Y5L2_9EUKA|nr:RNA-binding motif protein 14b [Anaeramoeba flamelloides]
MFKTTNQVKKALQKNNSQNVKNTKTHLQRDANTKDKNFLDHERSKKKKKFVSGVKITNKIFDHAKITETADLVKEKSSKAPIKPKHQLFCNNKKKNKKANGSQQQRNKKKQKKNNNKNNKNNSKRKLSQTQIIIFNYPHNYATDNLISFFQNFNPKNAVIIKKKKTKKYFAFVTFPSCVIRDKALHLNGLLINERPITIKKAYKKLLSNSKKTNNQKFKNSKIEFK